MSTQHVQPEIFSARSVPARLRDFVRVRRLASTIAWASAVGVTSFAPSLLLPTVVTSLTTGSGVIWVSALGGALTLNAVSEYVASRSSTRASLDVFERSLGSLMKRLSTLKRGGITGKPLTGPLFHREAADLRTGRSHHIPIAQSAVMNALRLIVVHGIRVLGVLPVTVALGVGFGGVGLAGGLVLAAGIAAPVGIAAGYGALRSRNETTLFATEEAAQHQITQSIEELSDPNGKSIGDAEIDAVVHRSRVSTTKKLWQRLDNVFAVSLASVAMLVIPGIAIATGTIQTTNPAALFSGLTVMVTSAASSLIALSPTLAQWREARRHLAESRPLRVSARSFELGRELENSPDALDQVLSTASVRLMGTFPDVTVAVEAADHEIVNVDLSIPLGRPGLVVFIDEHPGSYADPSPADALVAAVGQMLIPADGSEKERTGVCIVEDLAERRISSELIADGVVWVPSTLLGNVNSTSRRSVDRAWLREAGRQAMGELHARQLLSDGKLKLLVVEHARPDLSEYNMRDAALKVPVIASTPDGSIAWDLDASIALTGRLNESRSSVMETFASARLAPPNSRFVKAIFRNSSRSKHSVAIGAASTLRLHRVAGSERARQWAEAFQPVLDTHLPSWNIALPSDGKDRLASDLAAAAIEVAPELRKQIGGVTAQLRAAIDIIPESTRDSPTSWAQQWNYGALDYAANLDNKAAARLSEAQTGLAPATESSRAEVGMF